MQQFSGISKKNRPEQIELWDGLIVAKGTTKE
jgi:hypothetical protein